MTQYMTPLHKEISALEDLIFANKRIKLKCYGHVMRANNLFTTILESTTLGKRKNSR